MVILLSNNILLLDDEAFASNAIGGMLAYTIPSALELFSNSKKMYNYYDFNDVTLPAASPRSAPAVTMLAFEVSVKVGEETIVCPTKWGACRIRYEETFTPMYIDTTPSQVTFGIQVNFVMNPNACHAKSNLPFG